MMTVLGFKPWQKHPREPWKSQRWVLEPQNGQFERSTSSQIHSLYSILVPEGHIVQFPQYRDDGHQENAAHFNTILVSILEWINCGTDTAETSPDNSMDNSTEEEDQV